MSVKTGYMGKRIGIAAILLPLLFVAGCSANTEYRRIMDRAESVMNEAPDSALRFIREIDPGAIRDAAARARYCLLYSVALDKNYIDLTSDSLIRPAVAYYEERGNDREKARSYFYLGRIYSNMDRLSLAADAFLKADGYARPTDDFYLKGLIESNIGYIYSDQLNYPEALDMFRRAAENFSRAKNPFNEALMLSRQANMHQMLEEYDSAIIYYNQAKEIFLQLESIIDVLNVSSSLASIFYQYLGDSDRALNELLFTCREYNNGIIPLDCYSLLSLLYYQTDQYALAIRYALDYLAAVPDMNP